MRKTSGTSWLPAAAAGPSVRILFGDFALDQESRQLLRGGEAIRLGPKAFDLLDLLASQQPRALSKAHLRDQLWPRTFVADSNLTSLVTELRSALDDDSRHPRFIRTVYGFGYAFCGAVTGAAEEGKSDGSRGTARGDVVFLLIWGSREINLHDGDNVLGRSSESVVFLDSEDVSRRHAVIRVHGVTATIEDLGSKNGTRLGDRPIATAEALRDRDEIRIGRAFLTFRCIPAATTTKTQAQG